MALVTYTLLAAFASGHPEVLASSLSKSFAVVVFEFLCIRYVDVACFFENAESMTDSPGATILFHGSGWDVTSWMFEDLEQVELN